MNRQKLVTILGSLGVIPFLVALVFAIVRPEAGFKAFMLYSMAILCFLAGSWWSSALVTRDADEKARMSTVVLSNVIVLLALAFVYLGNAPGLLGLGALYLALMIGERKLEVFASQPEYYRIMRSMVSVVVVLLHVSCWLLVSARL